MELLPQAKRPRADPYVKLRFLHRALAGPSICLARATGRLLLAYSGAVRDQSKLLLKTVLRRPHKRTVFLKQFCRVSKTVVLDEVGRIAQVLFQLEHTATIVVKALDNSLFAARFLAQLLRDPILVRCL